MPYTPTGPATQRALQRLHPDSFVQVAILRVFRAQEAEPRAPYLQGDVADQLRRAAQVDGINTSGQATE